MDPHTECSDTKKRPKAYTQGMAPSSLLPTMSPTKTSDELVVFLASMVNQRRTLSVLDYTDFMRRMRWTIYQDKNKMQLMGNYLEVLKTGLEYWNTLRTG